MMKLRWISAGIAALALGPVAGASTATTNFNVTATVASNCKASAGNLAFGAAYSPGSGAAATTSTVSVNCTKGTAFTVDLGAGSSAGATLSNRNMTGTTDPANLLGYQLYTDAADTTVWGDGTSGTSASSPQTGQGMGSGSALALTVYGQIADSAANQAAAPDTYSDTVQVTVNY